MTTSVEQGDGAVPARRLGSPYGGPKVKGQGYVGSSRPSSVTIRPAAEVNAPRPSPPKGPEPVRRLVVSPAGGQRR